MTLERLVPPVFFGGLGTAVAAWGWVDPVLMQSRPSFLFGFLYAVLLGFCVFMATWQPK